MKIHLITFADGSENHIQAGIRFRSQASELNWFNSITIWNLELIKKYDFNWHSSNEDFIKLNTRGCGFWLWKSKIIELSILLTDPNDLVLYLDAGFEFNPYGKARLENYIALANKHDFLAFYLNGNNYKIIQWTKKFLLNSLNKNNYLNILDQPQIEAGCVFFKNNQKSIDFLNYWQEISIKNDYIYSNDVISDDEDSNFIEHRHDQSILTLLLHKERHFGITIRNENYFPHLWKIQSHPVELPFAGVRNLSPHRIL